MKTPSKKAIDAAYNIQPYNDLLYGDTTRPCNKEEVTDMLKAAYAVDFNEQSEVQERCELCGMFTCRGGCFK